MPAVLEILTGKKEPIELPNLWKNDQKRRHTMKGNYVLEIRQDKNGKWYIRPKAPNGRVLNHEYNSLKGAERGAKLFLKINRIKIVRKPL